MLTTLERLGLREEVRRRDLAAIRAWFARQDPEAYCERVFQVRGVLGGRVVLCLFGGVGGGGQARGVDVSNQNTNNPHTKNPHTPPKNHKNSSPASATAS